MNKTTAILKDIHLIGVSTRTNNRHIFESNPSTNPIAATIQKYFHNAMAEKMNGRKNPGRTFCVYTDYESDFNGDYSFFIGEEVVSHEGHNKDFETLIIPAQNYTKFTNKPGPMPDVCIEMWKNIWKMSPSDLGGERAYIADFEVYDERSTDHNNVTLDIYIGIVESV